MGESSGYEVSKPAEHVNPPEVAEGIMEEEVFKHEVEEAEQAATDGTRRVFDAGGNPGEVAEARDAGKEFLIKLGTLVRKTVREAAAGTVAGVGVALSPISKAANWVTDTLVTKKWWAEEDWSLPDEVRAEREAQIDEKYAKYQEEAARRERTEITKPATIVAEVAATNVPATMPSAESHYRNQLRENLDVQLRTLARTTDNPEERQKVEEKIAEFEAAIRKEGGGGSDKTEKSGTTVSIPETPYLAQLRENLDMQRRTLARTVDNPVEQARVEKKIEELRQAIQRETSAVSAESATLDDVERKLFTLERQRKATRDSRERAGIEAQLVALEQKREELRAVGVPSESPQSPEPQESQEPGGAKSAQAEQVPVVPLEEARESFELAAGALGSMQQSRIAGRVFAEGKVEIALAAYLAAIDRQVKELRVEKKHSEVKKLREAEGAILSKHKAKRFAAYQVFMHWSGGERPAPPATGKPAGVSVPEQAVRTPEVPEKGQNELQQATASLFDAAVVWKKTKENDSRRSERTARVNETLAKYLALLMERIDADIAAKRQELAGKGITGEAAGELLEEFYGDKIEERFIRPSNKILKNLGITGAKQFPALESFVTHMLDIEHSFDESV